MDVAQPRLHLPAHRVAASARLGRRRRLMDVWQGPQPHRPLHAELRGRAAAAANRRGRRHWNDRLLDEPALDRRDLSVERVAFRRGSVPGPATHGTAAAPRAKPAAADGTTSTAAATVHPVATPIATVAADSSAEPAATAAVPLASTAFACGADSLEHAA